MALPSYSLLNTETFQRLNRLNATRSVLQVITALNAFAMGKDNCFPALKTIQTYIGTKIGLNTISVALKWLRENNFIEQNHRTSKERFVMTFRRAVKMAKGVVSSIKSQPEKISRPSDKEDEVLSLEKNRKRQKKKKEFNYKKNKYHHYSRSTYVSKKEQERREAQRTKAQEDRKTEQNSGSFAFQKLVIGEPITSLSNTQRTNLSLLISNKESEFYKWAQEYQPKLLRELEGCF